MGETGKRVLLLVKYCAAGVTVKNVVIDAQAAVSNVWFGYSYVLPQVGQSTGILELQS